MGSPNLRPPKEITNQLQVQSTNKFAPFSNAFHKSANGNPNYKNYSQV